MIKKKFNILILKIDCKKIKKLTTDKNKYFNIKKILIFLNFISLFWKMKFDVIIEKLNTHITNE